MLKNETYINGQKTYELKDHVMTVYFKTGLIKAQGPFDNNQMEGEWMFYRNSGELWQIGHFEHNKKNGLWIRYNHDGQIEKKESFASGKLNK